MKKLTFDKIDVPLEVKDIENICSLRVEVGTTGIKGGDSGHGCRTVLRLTDLACTDMRCHVTRPFFNDDYAREIEITFGGDQELENFIKALNFSLVSLCNKAGTTISLDELSDHHLVKELERRGYKITDPISIVSQDFLSPKERKFVSYLYDLTKMYKETGSLKGMSFIRERHNISAITKETFYRTGLNELKDIEWLKTDEGKTFAQVLYKDVCRKDFINVKPYYTFTKGC